jgi:hypothetical protein
MLKNRMFYAKYIHDWVNSIHIRTLNINDMSLKIAYDHRDTSLFSLQTDYADVNSTIGFIDSGITADSTVHIKGSDLSLKIRTMMDFIRMEAYTTADVIDKENPVLRLYMANGTDQLGFSVIQLDAIDNITSLLKQAGLVSPTLDKLHGKNVNLHHLNGHMRYDTTEAFIRNIDARATWHDLEYTLDTSLPNIISHHTELVLKDGLLRILPKKATYASHELGSSWLSIDLIKYRLPIYLAMRSSIDEPMDALLEHFNVGMPFEHIDGLVNVTLTIDVDLVEADASVTGTFYVDKSTIEYRKHHYKLYNSSLQLDRNILKYDKVQLRYEDILDIQGSGQTDFDTGVTTLSIKPKKVNLAEASLALESTPKDMITYMASPDKEQLHFSPLNWSLSGNPLTSDAFELLFDDKHSRFLIEKLDLNIDDLLKTRNSGWYDYKHNRASFSTILIDSDVHKIKLRDDSPHFTYSYEKDQHTLTSDKVLRLSYDAQDLNISAIAFSVGDNVFSLDPLTVTYGNILHTGVSARFDQNDRQGHVTMHDMHLQSSKGKVFFADPGDIELSFSSDSNGTRLSLMPYRVYIDIEPTKSELFISSISNIYPHSPFLNDYNITNGYLLFNFSNDDKEALTLQGEIQYPYHFLVKDNKPVDTYTFKGLVTNEKLNLTVNEEVVISISDDIRINTHKVGYNSKAINAFIDDYNRAQDDNSSDMELPDFQVNAYDSFIYLSDRSRALAGHINITKKGESLTAKLLHKKGKAEFIYKNGHFTIVGKDFGGEFLSAISPGTDYEKGKLRFAVTGTHDSSEGVAYITDTTVKDFKVLNNVLAFINTVPSLATFSLPGYNSKGLKVQEAYTRFKHEKGVTHFKEISIDSKEIDILGQGITDYNKNYVDMNMTLKTDIGSVVGKIPVVGYIILGDDGVVSTSFRITGSLDKPEVKTQTTKNIVVAPFNIIKRAVTLPFKLFE